jgi:cold shock CspA family protein
LRGLSFEELEDGTEVVFNIEGGQKGPQATAVHPVPPIQP